MAFLAGGRFGWALSAMLRATPYASPTTPTAFLDRPNFPTDMPSICRLRWRQTSLQVAVLKLESVADFGLFLVVEFSGIRNQRVTAQVARGEGRQRAEHRVREATDVEHVRAGTRLGRGVWRDVDAGELRPRGAPGEGVPLGLRFGLRGATRIEPRFVIRHVDQ